MSTPSIFQIEINQAPAIVTFAFLLSESAKSHPEFFDYSHSNTVFPPSFNCYGFMKQLLLLTRPEAYKDLTERMYVMQNVVPPSSDGIPCPFNYVKIFQCLPKNPSPHWEQVDNPEKIRPGDIIAYTPVDYIPPKIASFSKKSTGTHLMLVAKVLQATATKAFLVIIDCTRFPHSKHFDGRKKRGIGTSLVVLHFGEAFSSVQWHFFGNRHKKEIAIGRLKSLNSRLGKIKSKL